jgi:hypothetical protein
MPSPMQPQGRKYASPMLSCQCQRRHLVMRHAQCECYGYCECGFSRCCRCPAEFRTCENTQEKKRCQDPFSLNEKGDHSTRSQRPHHLAI